MKDVLGIKPMVENEIKNIKTILNQKYFGEYPEYDSNYAKWSTKAIFNELHFKFKFDIFRDEDKKYFIEIIDDYIKKLYEKEFEDIEEEKTIAILVAMINLTAWDQELRGDKYKKYMCNSPTGNE